MLTRRVVAAVLTSLMVLGGIVAVPAPAAGAASDNRAQDAAESLHQLGLVEGDEEGYRLSDPITRAELAKLLIHAQGYGAQVQLYLGRGDFTDTAGHWFEGGISLARELGLMEGYPEGDFRPEAYVSYGEVLAVLARMAGLQPDGLPWPLTYLAPAKAAGIIPADWNLDWRLEDGASRGDVFIMLERTLWGESAAAGEDWDDQGGDGIPPALSVDPLPLQTQLASLPITGSARAAAVLVNGDEVPLVDGAFRWAYPLRVGPNTILVQAVDDDGDTAEESFTVRRLPGMADTAYTEDGTMVPVGESAILSIDLPWGDTADAEVLVSPKLGVFDPDTGVFTAGKESGRATVTVMLNGVQYAHEVAVTPGPVERMEVVPAEVTLEPGESVQFQAVAYDEFDNEVPLTDVTWSATGGEIDQEGRFEASSSKWTTAATVKAAFNRRYATAKATPLNYQVRGVRLAKPRSYPRADGHTEFAVTATLVDSKGKPFADYAGEVAVESSDDDVVEVLDRRVEVVNGVAEINLRAGEVPGSARITVTTNLGRTGTLTIPLAAQSLQAIRLLGSAEPGRDGQLTGVIEAIAMDQDGNPIREALDQTVVVSLSLAPAEKAFFVSNGLPTADIAVGDVDEETEDVRSRIYINYQPGTGTITVEGEVKTKELSKVKVLTGAISGDQAGRPAGVLIQPIPTTDAGVPREVYVDVVDEDGYRVTQPGPLSGLEVTLRDQNDVVWRPTETAEDGRGRATFEVTQMSPGTYTYTATLEPGGKRDTATQKVVAGAAQSVALKADPAALGADGRSTVTLVAELKDMAGNPVSARRYTFRFLQVKPEGAIVIKDVSAASGRAEVRVTAGVLPGTETYRVDVFDPAEGMADQEPIPSNEVTVTFTAP